MNFVVSKRNSDKGGMGLDFMALIHFVAIRNGLGTGVGLIASIRKSGLQKCYIGNFADLIFGSWLKYPHFFFLSIHLTNDFITIKYS